MLKTSPSSSSFRSFAVERVDIAVLPRTAQCDVGRLRANLADPALYRCGREFPAVVGTNEGRHAAGDKEVRQHVDHIGAGQLPANADAQGIACELIHDGEHAKLAALARALLDKVVRPHMVRPLRRSRPEKPSFSHRRPRFGCRSCTFNPSSRQMRSTRFVFSGQPSARSNAVIRR
jgi:hypothetical protein